MHGLQGRPYVLGRPAPYSGALKPSGNDMVGLSPRSPLPIHTKIGVAPSVPCNGRISGSVQCDEKLARWKVGI